MIKKSLPTAIFVFILSLAIHLPMINAYGFTWDFYHHFYAGAKFLGLSWNQVDPRPIPYTSPDPRGTYMLPYGPFVSIIPFISYELFHVKMHLLPEDAAYHLPIVIIGALGPALLFLFLSQALKKRSIAFLASLFLILTPRYFGDLHNNMKDIPMAVVFCLNVWLLWRLWAYRRMRDCILAAIGFAIAFSTKINALFIPIVFGVFLVLMFLISSYSSIIKKPIWNTLKSLKLKRSRSLLLYFIFAPIGAYVLWWFFWDDAIGELKLMFTETFLVGTNNIEVIFNGQWYCSGSTVPWFYPYGYLAITTPLPILVFFIIGAILSLVRFLRKKDVTSLFLLLWFFVPLSRYLVPRIGVIDGIRHFQEVVFPIVALSAIGFVETIEMILKFPRFSKKLRTVFIAILSSFIIYHLAFSILSYHPFQITYFNELVGGIHGAFGKYDLDYWGSSQKKAIEWLNVHAPKDAVIHIVMASDVASRYLRPDLLLKVNTEYFENSDYVVLLNRQSFFYRYRIADYILSHNPISIIETQGIPLVWIYSNIVSNRQPITKWWNGKDPCIILN